MFRRNRRFQRCGLRLLVLILLCYPLMGQIPAADSSQEQSAPSKSTKESGTTAVPRPSDSSVRLGAGDLIEVSVFGVPDLSIKARISNSGDVYLPLIDYIHIADLTTDEAQAMIEKRLEDGAFVRNPHVAIFVSESTSQTITVIGEVNHPGPYSAIGQRRLLDLISAAGGLSDKAGRLVTIIHRADPDRKVEIQLPSNLADDTQINVEIRPGDTIIVSRAGIIYVVGDVQRPSGFMIEDNALTVLKALALAGGGTRTASLNGTKILRQTPSGVQEIPVALKKVLRAKAPDVPLVKGDILFVPGSGLKSAAYRTADAAMSLTTALAVVAVHP